MAEAATRVRYSYAEYVSFERGSNVKHEYRRGEILAMAGGTAEHAQLAAAVIRDLGGQLRGSTCRVFTSDLRVRVAASELATYPDVVIVCGPLAHDPDDRVAVVNPTLLVEVLSDRTEAYDRGEKFGHYKRLDSLRQYVLVSHRMSMLEVWTRDAQDEWTCSSAGAGESTPLASVGAVLEVDVVYAGVDLETHA
jgi:Uma2 family endonuclease